MDKVYIVASEVVSYDDFNSDIYGVYTNEEKAKKEMLAAIDDLCETIKENLMDDFECEDEEERMFDTFEEYWEDWVAQSFVTPNYWRYSNDDDIVFVVYLAVKEVED